MTEPELIVADDAEAVARLAAQWLVEEGEAAVRARGSCSLALAGGTTPRAIHGRLVAEPLVGRLPWPRVEVFFGDERCVSPLDSESNYAMASSSLLERAPLEPGKVHRMEAERRDLDQAAADYAALLPDRLDVLLLGMGDDGHTASLFPRACALRERERRVVVVLDSPRPPPLRLTITPPVIEAARAVLVFAHGASKAPALARALSGPFDPFEVPIQLARRGTWIVDQAAAARAGSRPRGARSRAARPGP